MPDKASDPETQLALAALYWSDHGGAKLAETNDAFDLMGKTPGLEHYAAARRADLEIAKVAVAAAP